MKGQFETSVKRLEKLSREDQLDLVFDLINAICIVKNPMETAAFLQDLLTASEVKNLGKRLRIAKLLLSGKTQEEIISSLHCSYATIAKVNLWLIQGGEGFRKVITNLPKKRELPKLPSRPLTYHLPETLLSLAQFALVNQQANRLNNFSDRLEEKAVIDKSIQEAVGEDFKNKKNKKNNLNIY